MDTLCFSEVFRLGGGDNSQPKGVVQASARLQSTAGDCP